MKTLSKEIILVSSLLLLTSTTPALSDSEEPLVVCGDQMCDVGEEVACAADCDVEQLPKEPTRPGEFAEGILFENEGISIASSNTVSILLGGGTQEFMDFMIKGDVPNTDLTVAGLLPSTLYYIYTDGYENVEEIATGASGTLSFGVDLEEEHLIFMSVTPSTKYIYAGDGGDCASVGTWDAATKTCALNQDVDDNFYVPLGQDGVTLDCAGHHINGTGNGYGVYVYGGEEITVKNCNINNFYKGIYLYWSDSGEIVDNTITGRSAPHTGYQYGIQLYRSGAVDVVGNTIKGPAPEPGNSIFFGIYLYDFYSPEAGNISSNSMHNSSMWISYWSIRNNTFDQNT